MQTPQTFYRVANTETNQGLWYDSQGNFTGLIHDKFNFCLNTALPMPYDEEIRGWLSATRTLTDLFMWFTEKDIAELEKHQYYITLYAATKYREHQNHWVIDQQTSVVLNRMTLAELLQH